MLTVSKSGRFYIPGKPLSSDLRHIIIDKIIEGGGDPLAMIFPGRFVNLVSVEHASVLARDPLLPSQPCFLLCEYQYLRPTLILMLLAPLSNKPFICKLKYFLDKSTSSTVSSSITVYCKSQWIHASEGHLVHNAFYELAVFQAHKLFFDNIYWSYSFCIIVGVFYLDFNRHDTQIDRTTRRFPDRTISSLPSNATKSVHRDNECDNWRH